MATTPAAPAVNRCLGCLGAAGLLILAAGILAGCGCTSLIERDTPVSRSLERRLSEFSRTSAQGATRGLDELTDFPWDRVYTFDNEVATHREINAAVGKKVFDGCVDSGLGEEQFLIFALRGEVVHAVRILRTGVVGDEDSYSRSAALRAVSRQSVELVDRGR